MIGSDPTLPIADNPPEFGSRARGRCGLRQISCQELCSPYSRPLHEAVDRNPALEGARHEDMAKAQGVDLASNGSLGWVWKDLPGCCLDDLAQAAVGQGSAATSRGKEPAPIEHASTRHPWPQLLNPPITQEDRARPIWPSDVYFAGLK